MKFKGKKLIAIMLTLLFVSSCFSVVSFAATKDTVVKYGEQGGYLAIGDSVGRGCGSEGFYIDNDKYEGGQYDELWLRNVQGAYTTLVAEAVGCKMPMDITEQDANFWPFCYPGLTTSAALDLYGIEDNYSDTKLNYTYYEDALKYFGYEGSAVGAQGEQFVAGENGLCANIIDATQNADLITVELGMCDIFYRTYRIFSKGGLLKNGLSLDLSSPGAIADILKNAVELMKEGYKLWEEKYPMLIQRIKELNPDATIVMVGSFNVVNQMTLLENTSYSLGSIFSGITDKMNKQYKKWAEEYDVLYADIANCEALCTESDWSVLDDFLKDNNSFAGSHPSQNGHDYISRQILAQLPLKDDTKNISVDIGRFSEDTSFKFILVNGINVKNKAEIVGHQLTIPYDGPLATSLILGIENEDGSLGIQKYSLKYSFDTGYTAYREKGTNDLGNLFAKPYKLIGQLFQKLFDAIKGLFNK